MRWIAIQHLPYLVRHCTSEGSTFHSFLSCIHKHIKTKISSGLYKGKKSLPQINILKQPYERRSENGYKSISCGPMTKAMTIFSLLNATLSHVTSIVTLQPHHQNSRVLPININRSSSHGHILIYYLTAHKPLMAIQIYPLY